jgi:hypothetical protein
VIHVLAKALINHGADETCQVFTGGWLLTVFYSEKKIAPLKMNPVRRALSMLTTRRRRKRRG